MRLLTLIKFIIASCILLNSTVVLAGFSTYAKNWPDDADTVDERISKPEPEEQTTATVYTDATDKDVYNPNERIGEYKRLYAKLGLTFVTAQLRKISNVSQPVLSAANLISTDANDDYVSWEFGLGTKLKYVRVEADYYYQKNFNYNASPLFYGQPESANTELTTQTLWLALLYDMDKLNLPYFTPYIGGLAGFVWNKTRTSMYGGIGTGAAEEHSRYGIGWGVTIGARMPFWTRWFGYFAYQYLDQGMARYQSNSGALGLKGHYVLQGFSLGVQYLLG